MFLDLGNASAPDAILRRYEFSKFPTEVEDDKLAFNVLPAVTLNSNVKWNYY